MNLELALMLVGSCFGFATIDGADVMSIGLMGHEYNWNEVEMWAAESKRPIFSASAPPEVRGSGEGKKVLLHKSLETVAGYVPIRHQTIGDCVSQGFATAVDILMAVEIDQLRQNEEWIAPTASEPIYSYSRVEIGGGRIRGDGSVGAWGARAVVEGGTLLRQKYGNIELGLYDGSRARQWGRSGTPDELEPRMAEHPVREASLVTSYEDARDAIANGYPVVVCSSQGFEDRRDRDGFSRPSGTWNHCMCFIGVDDSIRRPGLLCLNSWGPDWISGPMRDQPKGSFWVDARVADKMLRRNPDSYSVSGHDGYPRQELNYLLI